MMVYENDVPFSDEYGRLDRVINANSAELRFVDHISHGDVERAMALIPEEQLFGGTPVVVDAPQGRFVGRDAIVQFAEGWLGTFRAQHAFVDPVVQTQGGGRSVTEAVVNFCRDGKWYRVPMFIVGDIRYSDRRLDGLRIYFHFTYVEGLSAYRPPIFQPSFNNRGELSLVTGAFGEYYAALHGRDLERVLKVFSENTRFGGYVARDGYARVINGDMEALRREYEDILYQVPEMNSVRFETIIDDGVTGVIEWTLTVTDQGRKVMGRVNQAGIAAYERGKDGKLAAVRICDYMGFEHLIDPALRDQLMEANSRYPYKAIVAV